MSGQTATWVFVKYTYLHWKNQRKSHTVPDWLLRMVRAFLCGFRVLKSWSRSWKKAKNILFYGGLSMEEKRSIAHPEMEEYVRHWVSQNTGSCLFQHWKTRWSGSGSRAGESCSKPYSRSLVQMTYPKTCLIICCLPPISRSDDKLKVDPFSKRRKSGDAVQNRIKFEEFSFATSAYPKKEMVKTVVERCKIEVIGESLIVLQWKLPLPLPMRKKRVLKEILQGRPRCRFQMNRLLQVM